MSDGWYEEIAATERLTQGDLILNCPLVSWEDTMPQIDGIGETERLHGMIKAIEEDTVVMTQACDLEHEKVQNVVLCLHLSLVDHKEAWEEEMRRKKQNPTLKAWGRYCSDIQDGFIWNLALLNEGRTDSLSIDHRVVDFRDIFTVPRTFLESLLQQRGRPRLRLWPPYREHLSQAFARFFMRVGLPTPVEKAW